MSYAHWPTYFHMHPPFSESGYGPVYYSWFVVSTTLKITHSDDIECNALHSTLSRTVVCGLILFGNTYTRASMLIASVVSLSWFPPFCCYTLIYRAQGQNELYFVTHDIGMQDVLVIMLGFETNYCWVSNNMIVYSQGWHRSSKSDTAC